jgi:hypothetical protein
VHWMPVAHQDVGFPLGGIGGPGRFGHDPIVVLRPRRHGG